MVIFVNYDSESTSEDPIVAEDPVLYGPQSVLVLCDLSEQLGKMADLSESIFSEQPDRMADVFIGVTKNPIKVNDKEVKLDILLNDSESPLTLVPCGEVSVKITDIQKDVQLESMINLSETEYELCRINAMDNQEDEDDIMEDGESQHLAHNLGIGKKLALGGNAILQHG